jgi:hypothetical protein
MFNLLHGLLCPPVLPNDEVLPDCPLTVQLTVPPTAVQLWWPNGMGPQPLYDLAVTLAPGVHRIRGTMTSAYSAQAGARLQQLAQESVGGQHIIGVVNTESPHLCNYSLRGVCISDQLAGASSVSLHLGFRTIELVTDPLKVQGQGAASSNSSSAASGTAGASNTTGSPLPGEALPLRSLARPGDGNTRCIYCTYIAAASSPHPSMSCVCSDGGDLLLQDQWSPHVCTGAGGTPFSCASHTYH